MFNKTVILIAAALGVLAQAASAQTGLVGSTPIPNGLSGPGGRETFTPSPIGNSVAQPAAGPPFQLPAGAVAKPSRAPAQAVVPRARK